MRQSDRYSDAGGGREPGDPGQGEGMEGRGTNLPRPAGWQSEPETAVARNDRTLLGASVLDHAAEYDKSLQGREMEARREVPRIAGTLQSPKDRWPTTPGAVSKRSVAVCVFGGRSGWRKSLRIV